MYKRVIRPLLFKLDPESAHHFTFSFLKFLFRIPFVSALTRNFFTDKRPQLQRKLMGINFPNPVGIAAGFDKNAELYNELSDLGFGFIEIGTVTPKPQPGNAKPRMFRLPSDHALINRMGFNNHGAEYAAGLLAKNKRKIIIGGNIGKNKITPNESAAVDYLLCFKTLFPYVDYFVVNVSSPNTPGLRELQEKEPLLDLLKQVQSLNKSYPSPKPVLLKIAPDLTNGQLDEIIEIVNGTQLNGIIATNTTISRANLKSDPSLTSEAGGLSGEPLKARSTDVIRYLRKNSFPGMVIIGAGGISTAADVREKMDAGADLIQVYTGFIYEGPSIVKGILKTIHCSP